MNLVDLVLLLPVAVGAWRGVRQGALPSLLGLAVFAGALAAAVFGTPAARAWLEPRVPALGVWLAPLLLLALLAAATLLLHVLSVRLLHAAPARLLAHPAQRALGVLPGAASGAITAAVVAALLQAVPPGSRLDDALAGSRLATAFAAPVQQLQDRLAPLLDPLLDRFYARIRTPTSTGGGHALPFRVDAPRPRADLEAQMLELLNAARAEQGLAPLASDPAAAQVARRHSEDMFERGYFSHLTPEGEDPFDRLRAGRVRFSSAGENIALARTMPQAHQGLMDSPGHRENILRRSFGRVGIGIVDGGRHGLMVTQNFRD